MSERKRNGIQRYEPNEGSTDNEKAKMFPSLAKMVVAGLLVLVSLGTVYFALHSTDYAASQGADGAGVTESKKESQSLRKEPNQSSPRVAEVESMKITTKVLTGGGGSMGKMDMSKMDTKGGESRGKEKETEKEKEIEIEVAKKEPEQPRLTKVQALMEDVHKSIEKVREMKYSQHLVMEKDETAQSAIHLLQGLLRELLLLRYGPEPYLVDIVLEFPDVMPGNKEETLTVKLAPLAHVPYSVFFFLENILKNFKKGAFHRKAGHVLQAMASSSSKSAPFAFQEYSPAYPHKQWTLGYAGRPSSQAAFYISTVDNSANHGPGSQGSKTEADCIIGELLDEAQIEVAKRMRNQPGGGKGSGFISDKSNFINIKSMTLRPH